MCIDIIAVILRLQGSEPMRHEGALKQERDEGSQNGCDMSVFEGVKTLRVSLAADDDVAPPPDLPFSRFRH